MLAQKQRGGDVIGEHAGDAAGRAEVADHPRARVLGALAHQLALEVVQVQEALARLVDPHQLSAEQKQPSVRVRAKLAAYFGGELCAQQPRVIYRVRGRARRLIIPSPGSRRGGLMNCRFAEPRRSLFKSARTRAISSKNSAEPFLKSAVYSFG